MNALHPKYLLLMLAALGIGACATNGPSDADRLAMYQAHAGVPVKQIRYYSPIGWDKVDGQHVLLTMRPREVWLLRLSGPCLDWSNGSPVLQISSQFGYVSRGFDRVSVADSQVTCRIDEIRPIDTVALRASELAAKQAQPSGT